jgi:hypothetical protein
MKKIKSCNINPSILQITSAINSGIRQLRSLLIIYYHSHLGEPKSDVEVATFGKIIGHFSPIVPPSAAGFASVASDAGSLLWWKLERSKSLVLLQVGGLTCRWERHSVKPSCWGCSTTVEQAETQLRVVVPNEEEEFTSRSSIWSTAFKFYDQV